MAGKWPTTATDADLYIAVNELQNNLSGAVNNSVTSLPLNSATGFPTVGLVLIDNEVIKYTGISTNTLTGCTRGFDGTTAAAHSSSAIVSFAVMAAHHNVLKDEIEAIEADLAASFTGGSTSIATTFGKYLALSGGTLTGTLNLPTIISTTVNPASTGLLRLAKTDQIRWRNNGNTADVAFQLLAGDVLKWTGPLQLDGNLSFAATGSEGITGTATSDNAVAGNIGEYISGSAAAVSAPASNTYGDIVSISLTAGDWDVTGMISCNINASTITAIVGGVSTTTGNSSTGLVVGDTEAEGPPPVAAYNTSLTIAGVRKSLSVTTTIYLKMLATYSAGTPKFYGRLSARRVR